MQHTNNVVTFVPVPVPADIAAVIVDDTCAVGADAPADDDYTDGADTDSDESPGDDAAPVAASAPDAESDEGKALLAMPPTVTETVCTALVSRAELAVAVAACARAVVKRSTIPILANVLLKAEDGGLVVVGTDLDIEVKATVSGAVDSHFESTVPAHKLLDMLKKAKASEMVAFDIRSITESGFRKEGGGWSGSSHSFTVKPYTRTDQSNVLDFDGLRVTLIGLPPADFPDMPAPVAGWRNTFTVPSAALARAFDKTEFCISTEERRYYLNGVYMHCPQISNFDAYSGDKGTLRFVATDGHRLGQVEVSAPEGSHGMPGVIVPRKTVHEVLRLASAKGAPESVTVKVSPDKVEFTVGAVRVLSKNIDGTFPDYARVIPLGNDRRMRVDCAGMVTGIEQVSIIQSERGRAVRLGIEESRLTLTSSNPDTGTARTSVPCDFDAKGGPLDVGFNSRYLLDVLGNINSEIAEFMLADPGSPTLIRGLGNARGGVGNVDKGVLFVLMPMRV